MAKPVVVGAVLYDPKVSVIWDIIREFFEENGCPMDVVFYTNYERQVDDLVKGYIDIAWNSPLAWLDAQRRSDGKCRAIAMRDTDRDRVSHIVVRQNGAAADDGNPDFFHALFLLEGPLRARAHFKAERGKMLHIWTVSRARPE